MKARTIVGSAVMLTVSTIGACSFGPDAYNGPDPLTLCEYTPDACVEGGDDGSSVPEAGQPDGPSGDDSTTVPDSTGGGDAAVDGASPEGGTTDAALDAGAGG
jgi:hypothetical protein